MKKTRFISFCLAVLLLLAAPVTGNAAEAENAVISGSHSLHAATPLAGSDPLLETAQAAIAYELNTDTLLYAWNPDARIYPTGIVKLLTVLVALEKGNLEDTVTVYANTLATIEWGAISAGLKAGEQVPMRDLLLCVMVASANDAAAVLAAHIAGDQKAFVDLMNQKAVELGCKNSNFTNVHGLNDENQYSTARDLAIIVEAALENETFCEMFAMDNFIMAATNRSEPRYFVTTNYMMSDEYVSQYFDYRVTGGKPAAASSTDRSMVCTAEVGNSRYLLVVMSAQSQVSEDGLSVTNFGNFTETKNLMNFAFNGYTVRQVLDKDQVMYQYAVQNGQNDVVLHPAEDVWVLLPAGYDKNDVVYHNVVEAGALKAPIAAEDHLGRLQISYQGLLLAECALLAMNPSPERQNVISPLDRIPQDSVSSDSIWDWLLPVLGIGAAVVALVALLIVLIIKFLRDLRIRRKQTQRARKRKRSY